MTRSPHRPVLLAAALALIAPPATAQASSPAIRADRGCVGGGVQARAGDHFLAGGPERCGGPFRRPAGASAGAAKRRACGTIASRSIYPFARVVAIRGVRCRRARRVARIYDHEGRSPGRWRCFLAHGDRPRLFSCGYPATRGDIRRARHAIEAIGTRRGEPR